jgi:Lar family restriction alleviation protein
MTPELLPCPFCGSHDCRVHRVNPNAVWVKCRVCGSCGPSLKEERNAVFHWNTRTFATPTPDHSKKSGRNP